MTNVIISQTKKGDTLKFQINDKSSLRIRWSLTIPELIQLIDRPNR